MWHACNRRGLNWENAMKIRKASVDKWKALLFSPSFPFSLKLTKFVMKVAEAEGPFSISRTLYSFLANSCCWYLTNYKQIWYLCFPFFADRVSDYVLYTYCTTLLPWHKASTAFLPSGHLHYCIYPLKHHFNQIWTTSTKTHIAEHLSFKHEATVSINA